MWTTSTTSCHRNTCISGRLLVERKTANIAIMCDFDLSQALESSPELDVMGFEACCLDTKEVQEETFRLDEGLDLVVSHNPMTMQSVGTLLLAVKRMKKSLTCGGRELKNDELCSVIMDTLVEETTVKKMENSSVEMKRIYHRVNSVKLCTLCDIRKKDVVHNSEELTLQAITLKGGHSDRKVNFKLSKYIIAPVSDGDGQAVLLSIPNNNLHISCSMKGDKATLKLEERSEDDLNIINNNGNLDRFLFYKRIKGMSLTTFESVLCRGWYISTSYEDENQPVEMCKVDTSQRLTSFNIN
ncbi:interleukin-1 beta [Enoplosus armatus]|uniref:interleukin-1 beta n=1 Tax=Enoplosus armatus TaxID=215367 RepID=UPI003994F55B